MSDEKPSRDGDDQALDELDARLRAARSRTEKASAQGGRGRESGEGIGFAFRIGVEIVAAIGIGAGVGWLLDGWLGTRPWLMILFFILGSAAGMMNVWRTMAGIGHGVGYHPAEDSGGDDKDDGPDRTGG